MRAYPARAGQTPSYAGIVSKGPALRRVSSVGIVVLVGAAFAVAVFTGGEGPVFLVSVVVGAGMLVGLVLLVAFSGAAEMPRNPASENLEALGQLESAASEGEGVQNLDGRRADEVSSGLRAALDARAPPGTLVAILVPPPRLPAGHSEVEAPSERLRALRDEGAGLIRLAKVMDLDLAPYRAFLADIGKAARKADARTTLRSLQLANELLRGTIENGLAKGTDRASTPRSPGPRDLRPNLPPSAPPSA